MEKNQTIDDDDNNNNNNNKKENLHFILLFYFFFVYNLYVALDFLVQSSLWYMFTFLLSKITFSFSGLIIVASLVSVVTVVVRVFLFL